jgi:hypothetical protein
MQPAPRARVNHGGPPLTVLERSSRRPARICCCCRHSRRTPSGATSRRSVSFGSIPAQLPFLDPGRRGECWIPVPLPPPTVSSLTLSRAMWRGENRHVLRDFPTGPLDCSIENYRRRAVSLGRPSLGLWTTGIWYGFLMQLKSRGLLLAREPYFSNCCWDTEKVSAPNRCINLPCISCH